MAQFEVDFSDSMRQLAELQLRMANMGKELDALEAKSGKSGSAAAALLRRMTQQYDAMEKILAKTGVDAETMGAIMERVRGNVANMLNGVASANARATLMQQGFNGELKELGQLLNDTASKNNYTKWAQRASLATQNLGLQNQFLQQQIGLLDTAEGKLNAELKASLATKTRLLAADTKLTLVSQEQAAALRSLLSEQGRANALGAVNLAGKRAEVTESARQQILYDTLTRTLQSLNGGMAESIARLQAQISARKAAIRADELGTDAARKAAAAEKEAAAAAERRRAAMEAATQARTSATTTTRQLSKAEAELAVATEIVEQKTKAHNAALLEEARVARGVGTAQKELAKARQDEIDKLSKLRAQRDLLSSAYGREQAQIQKQIADQQRLNRLQTESTASLLGLTGGHQRFSAANVVGSQSAAMMRAALGGLQANIGMYTSSTILAASATYGLARALRDTVELGAEFSSTIAKADAIMSTTSQSWMPSDMPGLEAQVRALGQSTMYTASEVGQGLVELGQAGFTAGQAIVALKPALDLAMIGGVSLAESADMATNVLMTFGKESTDLVGVVDMMAAAASQSNTNVQQLANALSYAGPAAHTAGISMEDTTAAIEALSNTGIKASRAGTALRKLFTSLLNPTKKGAQMMDEYGISVTDMEGNTRSLIDILGQLNTALKDVGEGERLSAIQNLVGLYATSSVAALVEQAGEGGNLEQLRRQLDETGGAAEAMRNKMENSLEYDWKQVISAFEEVQQQVFDAHEYQMREMSASLSLYLIQLTQPVKTLQDEYGNVTQTISQLDIYLQKGKEAAEGIAYSLGAALAFKIGGGAASAAAALASDAGAAAERLRVVATRMREASLSTVSFQGGLTSLKGAIDRANVSLAAAYRTTGLFGVAAVGTAKAVQGLAIAGNLLARAFGWAGLIYGLYSAFSAVFNDDSEKEILDQKKGIDGLKDSYTRLKEQVDATARARERAALQTQIDTEMSKIGAANQRGYEIEAAINVYRNAGAKVPTALTDELASTQRAAQAAAESVQALSVTLDKIPDGTARLTISQEAIERAQQYSDLQKKEAEAKKEYDDAEGRMRLKQYNAWQAAKQAVDQFKLSLDAATEASDRGAEAAVNAIAMMQAAREAQVDELTAYRVEKNATPETKMIAAQRQVLQLEKEIQEAADKGQGDVYQRKMDELTRVKKAQVDLKKEILNTAEAQEQVNEQLRDLTRTDEQRLAVQQKQLRDLLDARGRTDMASASPKEDALRSSQEELRLRQAIASTEKSIESAKKAANSEAERARKEAERSGKAGQKADQKALDDAQKMFDKLQESSDPVVRATEVFSERVAQLDLLLAKGKITADDRAKGMVKLREELAKTTLENDKNYQSVLRLREAYSGGYGDKLISDLADLDAQLRKGNITLEEAARLRRNLSQQMQDSATSGLPTANMSMGEASSTPFSDWMTAEIERANGLGQFRTRMAELDKAQAEEREIQRQTEAQQIKALQDLQIADLEEFQRRKTEIEQKGVDDRLAAEQRAGEARWAVEQKMNQYSEQSQKMVYMSMASSAADMLSLIADASGEATTAQKVAFVAQKAIAVAQIIMQTMVAAANAKAVLGVGAGDAAAATITAMGYASAGLVASLAIGDLSGGSKSKSGSGGSSTRMYDTGGYIPYNRVGIVGEYGPELVSGPAHVTGRGATASKLASGGEQMQVTLAPVVQITMGESNGDSNAEEDARTAASAVKAVCLTVLKDAVRPNGLLDNWYRAKRSN